MSSPTLASPLLSGRSLPVQAGAVAVGTLFLALSSWIRVPMIPVPMTMQTFAVLTLGALFGWRLGALTVLAWLGETALGLPVRPGFEAGLMAFAGPTAGYLVAYPVAAALTGWLTQRGWTTPVLAVLCMLAGTAVITTLGWAWLSVLVGAKRALAGGVVPFVLGDLLKFALAAAAVVATPRLRVRG